jgi:hypothetical protein
MRYTLAISVATGNVINSSSWDSTILPQGKYKSVEDRIRRVYGFRKSDLPIMKTCYSAIVVVSCVEMNRREFVKVTVAGIGMLRRPVHLATRHVILIVPAGLRKSDYMGKDSRAPRIAGLAQEGFVFEEDHCEHVSSHEIAFAELLQGYVGRVTYLDQICEISTMLVQRKPRMIVCRVREHEIAHESYEEYLCSIKKTDDAIGSLFDWMAYHPQFSRDTAIIFRPEFGRDDVVNEHGQLHHSYGFYSTHRVATIFWGPDFNCGIDRNTVVTTQDMAPTLAKLCGAGAIPAKGRVIPGLFRTDS